MEEDRLHKLIERVTALERELAAVRVELTALTAPAGPAPAQRTEPALPDHTKVSRESSLDEKIALFREYFVGRPDVYAHWWKSASTGKTGWSPTARSGFYRPSTPASDLAPFTADVVDRHLRRTRDPGSTTPVHAGLYPLLTDDTCRLLVCDFDDGDWRDDAAAYATACRSHGLDPLCEISRSGDGAHVWLFFSEPVTAHLARGTGFRLLQEAMESRPAMTLKSFDRFFPSQDTLPTKAPGRGRFGNLIALPLEGDHRDRGTTVFADPGNWEPVDDQFAALAAVSRASVPDMERVRSELSRFDTTPATRQTNDPLTSVGPRPAKKELRQRAKANKGITVRVTHDSQVHVPVHDIDARTLAYLRHLCVLSNPDFYRRQAMRQSTFSIPRIIIRHELDDWELRLPRGLLDEVIDALSAAGYSVSRRSAIPKPPECPMTFTGTLREEQAPAVKDVLAHRNGLLVAHPGAGKTVMACAVIAERQTSTAVIVPNQEVARQWEETLLSFTDIPAANIGMWFGNKKEQTRVVDIFSATGVGRRDFDLNRLKGYGQIIVDECHRAGAQGLEAALNQVEARYWLGVTATDYRSDGMDRLIVMQLGPVRHVIEDAPPADQSRKLVVHDTEFTVPDDVTGDDMPEIYNLLAEDADRNALIVDAVTTAACRGESSLVLCNRVAQVDALTATLGERLADEDSPVPVRQLYGGQSSADRAQVRSELDSLDHFVLVAIDKIAGEGLDLPALDSVFLCSPAAFKGNVIQRIGRVTRGSSGTATVHDFHDATVPVLHRMFMKRRRVVEKAGFVEKPGSSRA